MRKDRRLPSIMEREPIAPCWLCGRALGTRVEWHHPKPKSRGGRETVPIHPICHRTLHATFTNKELDDLSAQIRPIADQPALGGFLSWVRTKPADFNAPTKRRKDR